MLCRTPRLWLSCRALIVLLRLSQVSGDQATSKALCVSLASMSLIRLSSQALKSLKCTLQRSRLVSVKVVAAKIPTLGSSVKMNLSVVLAVLAKSAGLLRADNAAQTRPTVVSWAILVALIADQKGSSVDGCAKDRQLDCWPAQHWHLLHCAPPAM